ncbi:MAG: ABC transporter ATP-binding protein [Microbacterium gubbeenense]|uniref:ABC transporter ATP-binding protein n=5 Tax=Microbacterium gubbeenense TaxID=159896 RepID=UPI0003F7C7AF|nr:ABC transporter ATP-binding protein [Microbacterium gubbeenense]
MTGARVAARGWGWRYATRHAWAARGLDLDIAPGERILLSGLSGSGKSTLLHALAGVLGGDDEGEQEGSLAVDGIDPRNVRGRAGLVLQDPDTQAIMHRVGDDVAFGCENLGIPREETWRRVSSALALVGLEVSLDRSTSALSGGQKQRLALAGALAMQPGLLLLDEPTANLDPAGVIEVRDAVARVVEATGATLIVVEHRADVWRDMIDREVRLGAAGTTTADFGGTRSAGPETSGSAAEMPYASAPLLEARGLTVARVRGRVVAGPIDLAVMPGEVLGITGANGSGKSTLGRTLAGLLPPAGGAVVASDELRGGAKADPIRWTSAQLLTRIGTVLQSPDHQLLAKTVRDEIEVGPRALQLSEGEIGRRTDDLLERLRLDHLAAAHPHTLSGGEKRRLTVGAMLATRPRVCVLDEPTFGQDPQTWREMVAIMSALAADGIAIVAITHDLGLLHALGAREFRMGVSG